LNRNSSSTHEEDCNESKIEEKSEFFEPNIYNRQNEQGERIQNVYLLTGYKGRRLNSFINRISMNAIRGSYLVYTNLEMNQPVERNGNISHRGEEHNHQRFNEEQHASNDEYNINER